MQAVILAAGRSTRTYPLTSTRPKPLIPIWDRPLLEHQLAQLKDIVTEVIFVVGYRRDQIEAHFGNEHAGMKLRYVEQRTQRGTADAVLAARELISEKVIILNGDDFYHHDDLAALTADGRALLVTHAPDPENRAVVSIEDDAIVDIVEKPKGAPPDAWCSVGGYAVEASDLALLDDLPLSPRGELELPDFILRLVRASRVRPQRIGQWWLPITYAWDVLTAIRHLWSPPARAREMGLSEARADSLAGIEVTGPVWLGENVRIGAGSCLIGPTSLGPGTTVGKGAVVERSATFEGSTIGERARVQDSVIGAGAVVGAGAVLVSRPGSDLTVEIQGKRVVPQLDRLGSILGDGARVGEDVRIEAGTLIPSA